jgi:MFS family permease
MLITFFVGLSNFIWIPTMGAVCDRVGRRPLLIGCTVLALVATYPAMLWLAAGPSYVRLATVCLWLSFLYGSYNGALVVTLTEIMPETVRASGFALAYAIATAIFGGFTPAICTYMIHLTGNAAAPGIWVSVAAAISLLAGLGYGRSKRRASAPSAAASAN